MTTAPFYRAFTMPDDEIDKLQCFLTYTGARCLEACPSSLKHAQETYRRNLYTGMEAADIVIKFKRFNVSSWLILNWDRIIYLSSTRARPVNTEIPSGHKIVLRHPDSGQEWILDINVWTDEAATRILRRQILFCHDNLATLIKGWRQR